MTPEGSPPGSPVPGILQARTLEWVAISFSHAWKWKVKVKSLIHVQLFATLWTAAYQAPSPMGFSRQEYWSGLPLPSLCYSLRGHKWAGWLNVLATKTTTGMLRKGPKGLKWRASQRQERLGPYWSLGIFSTEHNWQVGLEHFNPSSQLLVFNISVLHPDSCNCPLWRDLHLNSEYLIFKSQFAQDSSTVPYLSHHYMFSPSDHNVSVFVFNSLEHYY